MLRNKIDLLWFIQTPTTQVNQSQIFIKYDMSGTSKTSVYRQAEPLTYGDRVISVQLGQYHGYWCPGSFRRQDISSHDIDYVE